MNGFTLLTERQFNTSSIGKLYPCGCEISDFAILLGGASVTPETRQLNYFNRDSRMGIWWTQDASYYYFY